MHDDQAPDYRQHLLIETPEHVLLDYELGGIGSRTLAALIDWAIIAILLVCSSLALRSAYNYSSWTAAIALLLQYMMASGYFAFFEGFRQGQTPGKRVAGIRVIRDTGHAVSFADAAARNLMNLPDMLLVGVFLIAIHPRAKRLGDLVAGTVVVRDKPAQRAVVAPPAGPAASAESAGAPELNDAEFKMLREFQQRAAELPPEAVTRLGRILSERLAAHVPPGGGDDLAQLGALYRDELARRQGRFGARAGRGGGSPAERLVARKSARWDEFQLLADRVTRQGLDALTAPELPDFAARYREVAADLARAHTYRADTVVRQRLERLVAAGHNALYREERRSWALIRDFVLLDCPGEIVASWRTVLLAFVSFAVPAVAGYATLRERPDLAASVIPDGMIERAEAGAARADSGRGYLLISGEQRPVVAVSIIINNVRVAFRTFMGGIFLGVGALLLLAFNGLSIGTISGYFANQGLDGYLGTFIAGHGVLELFAIWVAGAAGFLVGMAIIAPGRLPRSDAVAIAGRRAMRLMAAVILLLLVAGSIEGLVSAGDASVTVRLAITAGSVLFLVGYLWIGGRHLRAGRLAAI